MCWHYKKNSVHFYKIVILQILIPINLHYHHFSGLNHSDAYRWQDLKELTMGPKMLRLVINNGPESSNNESGHKKLRTTDMAHSASKATQSKHRPWKSFQCAKNSSHLASHWSIYSPHWEIHTVLRHFDTMLRHFDTMLFLPGKCVHFLNANCLPMLVFEIRYLD